MRAPSPPQVRAVSTVSAQKAPQLSGGSARRAARAVSAMMADGDEGVEQGGQSGMARMERRGHAVDLEAAEDAGLPRVHQRGLGRPRIVLTETAKMTMAGIMRVR